MYKANLKKCLDVFAAVADARTRNLANDLRRFGRSPLQYDVLGERLVLDSTDRENHFLPRFETLAIHNVRQNEGNLGAVRAINNSKSLRVKFLDDSYHFVSSPRARLFSFSISRGHRLSKELPYSLFFPAYWPELTWGRDCGCLKRKPYGKKDTPSDTRKMVSSVVLDVQ